MKTSLSASILGLALAAGCHSASTAPPPAPPTAPTPVASAEAPPAPPLMTSADLDALVRAEWQKAGVTPTATAGDATYLRRVHIDLTGDVPSVDEVKAFLADTSPDKRAKLVDALLASPRYADHWTNVWDRLLLGLDVRKQVVDREEFRAWLHERFAKNVPWNKVAYELVTASGQNTHRNDEGGRDDAAPVNGAVNYMLRFESPADLSGTTSRLLLGVQIQCAQCHDHKTEKWTMSDFEKLTACFMQAKAMPVDKGKPMGQTKRIDVEDVAKPTAKGPMAKGKGGMYKEYQDAVPAALDGTDLSQAENRRVALATWMTAPKNPWFAEAFVNRMWGRMLGRAFVEPVDDIRPTNPPVVPDVWKRVTDDFAASGYDAKHLLRVIALSEAYQRTAVPIADGGKQDSRLWGRFRLQPLGADELVDALVSATGIEAVLKKGSPDGIDKVKEQIHRQFAHVFDVDEDAQDDDFDGTITQTLMLLNGRITNQGASSAPGTAVGEALALPGGDDAKIRYLYLRALGREPSADETARWTAFVNAPREWASAPPPADKVDDGKKGKGKKGKQPPKDPLAKMDKKRPAKAGDPKRQAYEDVLWTLLNSSEFLFNH
jgi:hypothetical protein